MTTENELKRNFSVAIDEVIPPAPWLEAQVSDALRRRKRAHRGPAFGSGRGIGFAAGLATLLIGLLAVTALLLTTRIQSRPVPVNPPTPVATPSPTFTFTPSPAVRSASWPAGGPVPAQLAGCWQSQRYPNNPTYEVCLGQYSFDFGQGFAAGNVVVNGSEIDFISDTCTLNATFGYDRYSYTITGSTLVLTKFPTSNTGAWGNCGWRLQGSYTKVASP